MITVVSNVTETDHAVTALNKKVNSIYLFVPNAKAIVPSNNYNAATATPNVPLVYDNVSVALKNST